MSAYKAKNAPIMVIDEKTGQRQMIYAQLDANATSAATTNLMIQPGASWQDGHTYVVVLRDLRNASGQLISAPSWFAKLRDRQACSAPSARRPSATSRSSRRSSARKSPATRPCTRPGTSPSPRPRSSPADCSRSATTPSASSATPTSATARSRATRPPSAVTSTTPADRQQRRDRHRRDRHLPGSLLPADLRRHARPPASTTARTGLYATPTQTPGNVAHGRTSSASIPSTATPSNPARIVALRARPARRHERGDRRADRRHLATGHNMVMCATNWWGLAAPDQSLRHAGGLEPEPVPGHGRPPPAGRAERAVPRPADGQPAGIRDEPRLPGWVASSVLNTGELYYDGNSQGGIFGGITTAVSPDIRRAVLGVTGEDYANVLVQRSTDFGSPNHGPAPSRGCCGATTRPTTTRPLHDDARPDGPALGSRRSGRIRRGARRAPVRRHAVALGADADRLRRPSGQHVRGRRRGALDRRRRLRARRDAGLGADAGRRAQRQRQPVLRAQAGADRTAAIPARRSRSGTAVRATR